MFQCLFVSVFLFLSCSAFADPKLTLLGEHALTRFEQADLALMMNDMLRWIAKHSAYPRANELPVVEFVPPKVLDPECEHYCPVAQFTPEGKLLLSKVLDIFHDPLEASVVFHELAHYVQWRSGKYIHKEGASECEEDLARENEAYAMQHAYYSAHGGYLMPFQTPQFFCGNDGKLSAYPADH